MNSQIQSIRTFCRIKPLFQSEQKIFARKNICTVTSKNNEDFGFDSVFQDNNTNQEVYNATTKDIIQYSFKGYNSCVLAYGQTSSGKTYTMKGTNENPGIIPLTLRDVFENIQSEKLAAQIIISYIEIYNQNIIDLLNDRQNTVLEIRQDQKRNLTLTGLIEVQIKSIQEAMNLFQKGQKNRKFASNNVNLMSSRSHAIFRINMLVIKNNYQSTHSQINLVDLAGSESIDKTKGQKISKTEGENINKSILALTRVIKSMSQREPSSYVGFRDSKLTRILQKSLCQNAKSTIICMINPTRQNYQESINTLKFGQMAAKIKIQTRQNLIRAEETLRKEKNNNFQDVQFLPTEKMELEDARIKIKKYEQEISNLQNQKQDLQLNLYNKQTMHNNLQNYLKSVQSELEEVKNNQIQLQEQWWRQKGHLENKLGTYQEQIQNLERINKQLKAQKRQIEKNQKGLAEKLQYNENQLRIATQDLQEIKDKINQQQNNSNRSKRPSPIRDKNKPKKMDKKQNPFYIPPYDENKQRTSPTKLTTIMNLQTMIIDLKRKVNEFTKANIEIANQNQYLSRQIEQIQQTQQNNRKSSKINPEHGQIIEKRRLKNKIRNLQDQLNRSNRMQQKYKQELLKRSQQSLGQIDQFEEWYNRKYVSNYFQQKGIQVGQQYNQNDDCNPQEKSTQKKQKSMEQRQTLILNVQKREPDENQDMNIKYSNRRNQMPRNSESSEDQFLLDSFKQHSQNSKKNFINFNSLRRQKNSKNQLKKPQLISASRKMKSEDLFFPSNLLNQAEMIPEQEKQIQI